MKKLDSIMDHIEGFLCTLFATVMAFAILFQVLNRNFFNLPYTWGEELARYCMVWAVFIGISAGIKSGAHIGVDVLLNALSEKARKAVKTFAMILTTVIYAYLFVLSVQITLGIHQTGQLSAAMKLPMYIVYCALVVGMLFSTVRSAMVTYDYIAGKNDGNEEEAFANSVIADASEGGETK